MPLLGVDEASHLAAPLLKLDPQPPIELSSENRLLIQQNLNHEQQRNIAKQEERQIPWLGLVALSCVGALLLTAKKKPQAVPKTVAIEPRQAALQRLAAIQRDKPEAEQLYVALTSTVREYLEDAYHLKAQTQTTEEFLQELTRQPIFDKETKRAIVAFLEVADAVKFGRYKPTDAERDAAVDAAKTIFR